MNVTRDNLVYTQWELMEALDNVKEEWADLNIRLQLAEAHAIDTLTLATELRGQLAKEQEKYDKWMEELEWVQMQLDAPDPEET